MQINNEVIEIDETHKNYYLTPSSMPVYMFIPKNDIKVFGQGLMSLSDDMYFNPEIYNLRNITDFSNIDYLITDYIKPTLVNGWQTGKVSFDLNNASVINRKLRFAISFFDRLENVTGMSAFTRTAETKTSSKTVDVGSK